MNTPRRTVVVPEKYLPFVGAAVAAVVTLAYILWGPDGGRGFRTAAGTSKQRRVAGLQNLGNTCYLNTILQGLAACPLFVKWLSRALRQGFFKGKHNELAYKLSKTLEVVNDHSMSQGSSPVYSPHEVLHALYKCSWKADKDQQDAHELFQFLLSILGEEKETIPSPVPLCDASKLIEPRRNGLTASHSDLHSNIDACLPKVANRDWESPFRGLLANHLSCTVCGHRNPLTYSSFDCLTLPIPATLFGTLSLESILSQFTQPELVRDVECTECSKEIAGKASPPQRKSSRKLSPPSTKKICPPTPKKVRSPTAVSMRPPLILQGTKTGMFAPVTPPTYTETLPTLLETPLTLLETPPALSEGPLTLSPGSMAASETPATLPETPPTSPETPPTSPETPSTIALTTPPDNQSDVRTLSSDQSSCEFTTNGPSQWMLKQDHVRDLETESSNLERPNSVSAYNGNSIVAVDQLADLVNPVDKFGPKTEATLESTPRKNKSDELFGLAGNSTHTMTNGINCSAQNGEQTASVSRKYLESPFKMETIEPIFEDGSVHTKQDCQNFFLTASDSLSDVKQSDKMERVTYQMNGVSNDGAKPMESRQVPSSNSACPSLLKPCNPPSPTDGWSVSKGRPAKSTFGRIPGTDMPLISPEVAYYQSEDDAKSLESGPKCRTTFRKQLTLGKLPQCLCIHLQRVTWLPNGLPSRREEHVMFPEYLDLSPYKQTAALGYVPGRDAKLMRLPSDTSSEETVPMDASRRKSGQGFIGGNFLPDNATLSLVGGSLNQLSPRLSHHAPPSAEDRASGALSEVQNRKGSLVSEASGNSKHAEARYRLASAVVHRGDAFSGHFMTFRRAPSVGNEPLSDNWLCISDESVDTLTAEEVFSQKAYMLYYQRV